MRASHGVSSGLKWSFSVNKHKIEGKEPEQNLDQKSMKVDDKLEATKDFPKFLAGETSHLAVHAPRPQQLGHPVNLSGEIKWKEKLWETFVILFKA